MHGRAQVDRVCLSMCACWVRARVIMLKADSHAKLRGRHARTCSTAHTHTHTHTHTLTQWFREETKMALAEANEVFGPSSTACAARASLSNFSNVLSVEEEAVASRV